MTRDPKRIPEVLELVQQAWQLDPDQRLGQLILNACRGKTPAWPDVFNVEDEALLDGVRAMLDRYAEPE